GSPPARPFGVRKGSTQMWRKHDEDREAKARAIPLASVLGVELDDPGAEQEKPPEKETKSSQSRAAISAPSARDAGTKDAHASDGHSQNAAKSGRPPAGRGSERAEEPARAQTHVPPFATIERISFSRKRAFVRCDRKTLVIRLPARLASPELG